MNYSNDNQNDPLYRFGEYMIRRCGANGWEYCNGDCNSCNKSKSLYATDHTIIGNNDKMISTNTTSSQGFPKYLIRNGGLMDDI